MIKLSSFLSPLFFSSVFFVSPDKVGLTLKICVEFPRGFSYSCFLTGSRLHESSYSVIEITIIWIRFFCLPRGAFSISVTLFFAFTTFFFVTVVSFCNDDYMQKSTPFYAGMFSSHLSSWGPFAFIEFL